MDDVGLRGLERLEVVPVAPRKNSSFMCPNSPRCVGVVQAVCATCLCTRARAAQPLDVPGVWYCQLHVGLHHRTAPAGTRGSSSISSCCAMFGDLDIDQAAISRCRSRRPARGRPCRTSTSELGDVGAHLLPRAVGGEVAAEHRSLKVSPTTPFIQSCTCGSRSPPYAAAQAHLAHHLSTVLSATTALRSARRHIAIWRCLHLAGRAGEYLLAASHSSGLVGFWMRQRVVAGRAGASPAHSSRSEKRESPRKLAHGLGPRPGSKPSSAFRAIDF